MIIPAKVFVNAHLITILFHLILAIMIFSFASETWSPSYNRTCATILFIVSFHPSSVDTLDIKYNKIIYSSDQP